MRGDNLGTNLVKPPPENPNRGNAQQGLPANSSPANELVPTQGRLAGIDFGSVRVGIAICDPSQRWATPVATYTRRNNRLDRIYFSQLAAQEQLVGWIVGLPIHCDGKESQKSGEARQFADWLGKLSDLPTVLFDERFTTAEARRLLNETNISSQKKKKRLDGLAAQLILAHYLESPRFAGIATKGLEDSTLPPE